MKRKTKKILAVIVNNSKYGEKEYVVIDKKTHKLLLYQTYRTIHDARKDAKLKKLKLSKYL